MKKLLAIILVLSMVLFVFSGCNQKAEITPAESSKEEKSSREKRSSRDESKEESEEESSEEEESKEESKSTSFLSGKKPDVGPLSDEWSSFQIQIGDDVYQFPMTFAEFTAYGWTYKEKTSKELGSGYYVVAEGFSFEDGLECYARVINFDVNAKPIEECYISGIDIDGYYVGDYDKAILLPQGVQFGKTTLDEVIEKYGTPTSDYQSTDGTRSTVTYTKDYNSEIDLAFNESKVLSGIEIENAVKPENFEVGGVSDEVPKTTAAYKAPTSKNADLGEFVIELAGDLYQLPAPVSEFLANGFKLDESKTEPTVAGRGTTWLYFTKDNQILRTIVTNYSENATNIENAFITYIEVDSSGKKLPMTIGKDISIGMDIKAFEKAISQYDFEKDDDSTYNIYYAFKAGSGSYNVVVGKETNLVEGIKADNALKYKDFAIV